MVQSIDSHGECEYEERQMASRAQASSEFNLFNISSARLVLPSGHWQQSFSVQGENPEEVALVQEDTE